MKTAETILTEWVGIIGLYEKVIDEKEAIISAMEEYREQVSVMLKDREAELKIMTKDRDRLAIEFAAYMMDNSPLDYEGELHYFKSVIDKK
jgi:hypothetical protein